MSIQRYERVGRAMVMCDNGTYARFEDCDKALVKAEEGYQCYKRNTTKERENLERKLAVAVDLLKSATTYLRDCGLDEAAEGYEIKIEKIERAG